MRSKRFFMLGILSLGLVTVALDFARAQSDPRWDLRIRYQWLGGDNPRQCTGSRSDCKDETPYVLSFGPHGAPGTPSCESGNQVLCSNVNNEIFETYWAGAAPFYCENTPKVCYGNKAFFISAGRAGDGKPCLGRGAKPICGKEKIPDTGPILTEVYEGFQRWHMVEECPVKHVGDGINRADLKVRLTPEGIRNSDGYLFSSVSDEQARHLCENGAETIYVIANKGSPEKPVMGDVYMANVCKNSKDLLMPINSGYPTSVYEIPEKNGCQKDAGGRNLRVVHSMVMGDYPDPRVKRWIKGKVLGAGLIEIENGKVKKLDNCSGHYRPPMEVLSQTVAHFTYNDVAVPKITDFCP